MNTDQRPVRGKNDDLTDTIIGVFYEVYNELGTGFVESVYREAMRLALEEANLKVEAEMPITVMFRGKVVGVFRADLVVNHSVLIELEASEGIIREHEAQTLD